MSPYRDRSPMTTKSRWHRLLCSLGLHRWGSPVHLKKVPFRDYHVDQDVGLTHYTCERCGEIRSE